MMRYVWLCIVCMLLQVLPSRAQYTLVKPNGYLELSGYVVGFYNYRFYNAAEEKHKKNRFALDFAVLKLDGNMRKRWNYQLQMNYASLFDPQTSDDFLMDGYISYNSVNDNFEWFNGYMKVPFSRNSLVANVESPFLQRAEIVRQAFNRRDLGTMMRYSFFNKKINVYAGAFTGLGRTSLAGDNDASGNMEFAGRVEFSYPTRFRKTDYDLTHTRLPLICVAANTRWANKQTNAGDDFKYQTLNGKKMGTGLEADAMYKGIALHAEWMQFTMYPKDSTFLYKQPTDHFLATGFIASANYYHKPSHTVIGIRYDMYNPNDLVVGDDENSISYAFNYLMDGTRACIKLQYWQRLKASGVTNFWTRDQIRLAYQLQF